MDDRELTEHAAKAASIKARWLGGAFIRDDFAVADPRSLWNPLANDGDALRLAVKLRLIVQCDASPFIGVSSERHPSFHIVEGEKDGDALASARRAIVRAAAELAKAKS